MPCHSGRSRLARHRCGLIMTWWRCFSSLAAGRAHATFLLGSSRGGDDRAGDEHDGSGQVRPSSLPAGRHAGCRDAVRASLRDALRRGASVNAATVTQAARIAPATVARLPPSPSSGPVVAAPAPTWSIRRCGYPAVVEQLLHAAVPAYYPPATCYCHGSATWLPAPQREAGSSTAQSGGRAAGQAGRRRSTHCRAKSEGRQDSSALATRISPSRSTWRPSSAIRRPRRSRPIWPSRTFGTGFARWRSANTTARSRRFAGDWRIRSDWSDSPFRLDQLYGRDRSPRRSHLENLAKAVEANPFDSNLLMALGMELYFDGQRDRARVFFSRAAQLGGNERSAARTISCRKPGPGRRRNKSAAAKIVF